LQVGAFEFGEEFGTMQRAGGLIADAAREANLFGGKRLAFCAPRFAEHQQTQGAFANAQGDEAQRLREIEKERIAFQVGERGVVTAKDRRRVLLRGAMAGGQRLHRFPATDAQIVSQEARGRCGAHYTFPILNQRDPREGHVGEFHRAAHDQIEDRVRSTQLR
jgi:hypothetical protein